MMEKFKMIRNLFFLVSTMIFIVSCGGDDEVDLDNYLTGKWHSYKAVVSAQNKSIDVNVSKTGKNSQFYYEVVFKSDNKVELSYYEVDDNMASRWKTDTGSYSVNGDVVTVYDENASIDFMYNSKDKTMYMRAAGEVEDVGYTTVFLYFKK